MRKSLHLWGCEAKVDINFGCCEWAKKLQKTSSVQSSSVCSMFIFQNQQIQNHHTFEAMWSSLLSVTNCWSCDKESSTQELTAASFVWLAMHNGSRPSVVLPSRTVLYQICFTDRFHDFERKRAVYRWTSLSDFLKWIHPSVGLFWGEIFLLLMDCWYRQNMTKPCNE